VNAREAVNRSNHRTRTVGLPATLTHDEWTRTVAAFGGACAYCQSAPAAHLDHFVPVAAGGGTTPGNCLPACGPCNGAKAGRPPEELGAVFDAARVEALRSYLASRSTGQDTGRRTADLFTVRVEPEVLARIDAEVDRRNRALAAQGASTNRGAVMALALREFCERVEAAAAEHGGDA